MKGNPQLFHFDHYESTTLTITPEEISLVDNYFRLDETNSTDSAMFEVKVNQKDSIARLIRYFNISGCGDREIINSLYKAMENYAREQRMDGLDLFGKLFKEISVEFKATCYM